MIESPPSVDDRSSVDRDELARFAAQADAWWDPTGAFRQLHKLNPTRLRYIRDRLAAHFDRDVSRPKPFAGLRVLDLGCGGGLASEPMARLGADVVGIDAAAENIEAAARHAAAVGLEIDYRCGTAEQLAAAGNRYDVVLALEIIEHVTDMPAFIASTADLLGDGGAIVLASLNRTPKSFLLAIVGAEYLLGWVPRGTHRWDRFVRPSELARALRRAGLALGDVTGVAYDPFGDGWKIGRDTAVNYMAFATRAGAAAQSRLCVPSQTG